MQSTQLPLQLEYPYYSRMQNRIRAVVCLRARTTYYYERTLVHALQIEYELVYSTSQSNIYAYQLEYAYNIILLLCTSSYYIHTCWQYARRVLYERNIKYIYIYIYIYNIIICILQSICLKNAYSREYAYLVLLQQYYELVVYSLMCIVEYA